ncbi:MAG: SlyX family protein [Nannocystaceae bacterium]
MSTLETAPGELAKATDERITELEIRIAYQDNLISDLDEVLRQFTRRVEVLEQTQSQLRGQLQALAGAPSTADEPPPHY